MNKKISLTGKWKGEYIYGEEYGTLYGKSVEFYLFLEENVNEFFGKAFDMEAPANDRDVPSIKGFCNDGAISFIKYYDTGYIINEDGSYELNKDDKGVEVHYYGNYDSDGEEFLGSWEILMEEEKVGENYVEYLCTGTWRMKKDED